MPGRFTLDLGPSFFPRHAALAMDVEAESLDLLKVEMAESGVRASARNAVTNAVGLIQFMPRTLELLGWTKGFDAFAQLTAEEQLPWVRRYFTPYKGKLTSALAVYLAVFLPAYIDRAGELDFVLAAKGGRLGWVYAANSVFDANHDYVITVEELGKAIARNAAGPRWGELYYRETGAPFVDLDVGLDLGTTLGQQRALAQLGFPPGALDGYPGPNTRKAVIAFQKQAALPVDGIFGPVTRAALTIRLAA